MQTNSARGHTLLEVVIYTGIFTLILLAIVGALFSIIKANRYLAERRTVAVSAHVALERITRDARDASTFGAASIFDADPSTLVVDTGETSTTFYVEDGVLKVSEDDVPQGILTREGVTVSSFIVHRLVATSTYVRIELELQAGTSTSFFSKRFYTSAVLRNAN